MDSKAASAVEKYQESKLQESRNDEHEAYESEDELLASLDNDDDVLGRYRELRIQQMQAEFSKINNAINNSQGQLGEVVSCADEKEVMKIVTDNDTVLVHFYQPNFAKCKVMNERLETIAEKHLSLKVAIIKAQDAPFLVTKLNIKVLPLVLIYHKGVEINRIVGFERLGSNSDTFSIEALEQFLITTNVISRRTTNHNSIKQRVSRSDEEEDDDW